jgi:rhodanese-related sulfurtransferase
MSICYHNAKYIYSQITGNIAADELNKHGFDAVTIEGGYSAWKDEEKKNKDNSSSNSK